MPEDQDLTSHTIRLPSLVLDRVADIAAEHRTTTRHVYRTAARTVALHPPAGPISYPSVIHVPRRGSMTSIPMTRNLREVIRYLQTQYFYERPAWLYLYGTAVAQPTFLRLLALDDEALALRDEERYRHWLHGGQPACIPTTARAPGVRYRRRTSRA
jgi:hypothetical protein